MLIETRYGLLQEDQGTDGKVGKSNFLHLPAGVLNLALNITS